MKVKIVKVSPSVCWYADKVGQIFEVHIQPTKNFITGELYYLTKDSSGRYINIEDVDIVSEKGK